MNGFQDRRARATNNELLNTKLTPPRLGTALVSRGLLLARLDAGLERPLTVLSAPAGFGKTTLAGEWIAAHAAQADLLAAWVALDESDNDPQRFWRYVITACRAFDGAPGRSALAALRASQTPALENVLVSFINELARLPTRSVLVLDDYHLITSPEIHETLSFLLDHFPAPLHLILITRSEPPLPLARLRARNQLNELDAADLRFSFDEMRLFFQQVARLPLSIEVLTRLEARTEGWAAGLRLIALALEGRSDQSAVEQFLTTFSGGHKHILEYLLNEVLINQPEPLQMFLLQTSFLNRLTGALCAAVTGRSDSSILLEQLARVNLFLIPLGSEGNQAWYRYHPLFAEAMQQSARTQLGEAAIQALLAKASEWHEAHAGLPDAIETALAARQFDRAGQLIERLVEQRGFNELYTLRRWAEQLPVDVLQAHPIVCFNLAMALLFTSDRTVPATAERVEQPLHMAEEVWRQAEDAHQLGRVLALRSILRLWQGDLARSFDTARQALALLPEQDAFWRGVSLLDVGLEELLAGRIDATQRILLEARALSAAAQNMHAATAAAHYLGEASLWQAELDQAEQLFQQVLIDAEGEQMPEDRNRALAGLGASAFERNDLTAAEHYATQAFELAQQRSDEELKVRAGLILARVQQARGQTAQALDRLHLLAAQTQRMPLLREVPAWQTRFSLANGDLAAAQHWASAYAPGQAAPSILLQELEALTLARIQIATGQPAAALKALEAWQLDAHRQGRTRSELEILCLNALAHSAQAETEQAQKALVRALTLAQPKGCQRVFLDEGEALMLLLQTLLPDLKKRRLITFATLLLRAFASTRSTPPASAALAASPLLEPLSVQEQRVLRLLAAGLSNPEIARELVVSVNTIKTQVKSIYRKLNVSNREEASEIARQSKLG